MKNSIITLGLTAVLIGLAMPSEAADVPEAVAFKYNPGQTATESYDHLKQQARRACGQNYYSKANRKCVNAYLQEILPKIGSRKLTQLHNDRMYNDASMRQYAVIESTQLALRKAAAKPQS